MVGTGVAAVRLQTSVSCSAYVLPGDMACLTHKISERIEPQRMESRLAICAVD